MRVWDVFTKPVGEVARAATAWFGSAPSRAASAVKRRVSRRDIIKASAALTVAGAAGVVAYIPRRHNFGKTFILYTADACRADVIGKVINGMEVTPNLNRLAEKGLYFPKAYSSANHTRSGVAGILTGEPEPVHGVTSFSRTIPVMTTLASYLAGKGYGTLAAVSNQWLEAETVKPGGQEIGFARGFQKYNYLGAGRLDLNLGGWEIRPRVYANDEAVRKSAFGALGPRLKDREFNFPALAWVHSMRTHWPRLPERPNEFTGKFHRKGLLERLGREQVFEMDWGFAGESPHLGQFTPNARETELARAIYYEAAAYMDAEFGKFAGELRGHESSEVTVIFTADHGESLGGEDREFGHNQGLGEAVLRVPLIISGGDVAQATVDKRVPNYCILQTVMMLLGDYEADSAGFALDARRISADAPICAYAKKAAAYITPAGTKVQRSAEGKFAFYDVAADPNEAAPLAVGDARETELAAELAGFEARCDELRRKRRIEPQYTRIGWQLAMSGLSAEEIEKIEGVEHESETLEKAKIDEMKALGYVQ